MTFRPHAHCEAQNSLIGYQRHQASSPKCLLETVLNPPSGDTPSRTWCTDIVMTSAAAMNLLFKVRSICCCRGSQCQAGSRPHSHLGLDMLAGARLPADGCIVTAGVRIGLLEAGPALLVSRYLPQHPLAYPQVLARQLLCAPIHASSARIPLPGRSGWFCRFNGCNMCRVWGFFDANGSPASNSSNSSAQGGGRLLQAQHVSASSNCAIVDQWHASSLLLHPLHRAPACQEERGASYVQLADAVATALVIR